MTTKEVAESIAYCGLVCGMCHLADTCGGCRSETNCCGNHLSELGCYQYDCCIRNGYDGCWECAEAPCGEGMFAEGHDIRLRAFVRFIRIEGKEKLAELLVRNAQMGIQYGHGRDYDRLGSEESVIQLLTTGEKQAG